MSKPTTFEVVCPCCKTALRIDRELGAVLSHQAPRQTVVDDLAEAARALREKESRRDEQFQKSVTAQRQRGELLRRKFDDAFEKAKDQPVERPLRDIDLD